MFTDMQINMCQMYRHTYVKEYKSTNKQTYRVTDVDILRHTDIQTDVLTQRYIDK